MDFFDENGSQRVSGLMMVKAWVSRLRVMMWQTFKIVDSSYSCISFAPKSYFQYAKTATAFYQKCFQRYVPKILNHSWEGPLCNILETLVSTILTHSLAVRARTSLKDILQAVRNQMFKTFTLIISNFVINDIRLRPKLCIKGNKAMVGVWLRVLAIRSHTVTLPPTMTYVTHLEKFLSFKNSFFTIIFVVTKKRSSVEFIWFHIEIRSLRY